MNPLPYNINPEFMNPKTWPVNCKLEMWFKSCAGSLNLYLLKPFLWILTCTLSPNSKTKTPTFKP
jgi:hypothetical protein